MATLDILVFCVTVAMAAAQWGPEEYGKTNDHKVYYGGLFQGTCKQDGIYWKDLHTLAFCTNGRVETQSCPPGTRNADHSHYHKGRYAHWEFCNVRVPVYHPPAPVHKPAVHHKPAYRPATGYATGYRH